MSFCWWQPSCKHGCLEVSTLSTLPCEHSLFRKRKIERGSACREIMHLQALVARSQFPSCAVFAILRRNLRQYVRDRKLTTSASKTRHRLYGAVVTEHQSAEEQLSPVVALLGWNSSKEKHLKKYSEIFEAKGFDTVCVPAKPFNTFFRAGSKVKQIGLHVLDVLLELNCQQRPVFLYAFSNGGCAMFFHIMEALTTLNQPYYQTIPVVGTMFDSCPINPDINSLKATQESVTDMINNPILKPIVWYTLGAIVPPVIYFNSTVKRYMSSLVESPLHCPQLLMYSKSDRVAPYQDIDLYAEARREQGIKVITKCWESSKHVNHYREHTNEYLNLLHSFIDDSLVVYDKNRDQS